MGQAMAEISALIAALSALIVAVMSVLTFVKMRKLEHNTNAMKDELVMEVRKASVAIGVKEEKERRRKSK